MGSSSMALLLFEDLQGISTVEFTSLGEEQVKVNSNND